MCTEHKQFSLLPEVFKAITQQNRYRESFLHTKETKENAYELQQNFEIKLKRFSLIFVVRITYLTIACTTFESSNGSANMLLVLLFRPRDV